MPQSHCTATHGIVRDEEIQTLPQQDDCKTRKETKYRIKKDQTQPPLKFNQQQQNYYL